MEKWQPQNLEQLTISRRELDSLVAVLNGLVSDAGVVELFSNNRHQVDSYHRVRGKLDYARRESEIGPGIQKLPLLLTWPK